ncbi:vancomycin resistance DNA-binding response regulator VanR [Coprobacillus cateniformis]|nr:response regulator [Coprobacillus cateniformis]PWM86229.1 MAG: vancomycin resistance DNA-binding response regulator VanR [Coprobacillus sp.]RGO14617.1 vancomycin resistance DNA-binding response regulator VanR [Coprobacillus cateniformis]RGO23909.1 vancomycin resistance DNA-binding response regulator VanR [Coprobacillus cateniformis]RGY49109.1 vancomycin resistance DNA-binding response regulator VanR [Coprobacillus cateniformis]
MMEYNVLVVEDEIEICDAIEIYLKTQGYHVYKANNGQEGLNIISNQTIHLAIVDIMMPIMDGIQMTMKVRENYDFPIIMLSAKSEDIDKITGLNIGADDYVTKPFVPMELLARVSSQLRRYSRYLNVILDQQHENSYVVGGLELNLDTKQVTVEGKIIKVTPIEFKILQLLMEYPGKVFSADNIYESVWQEDAISTDTVMVHVRNLREKIEIDPKNPRYLKVVWGVGYKIEK